MSENNISMLSRHLLWLNQPIVDVIEYADTLELTLYPHTS